jgi:hypothetical protein
VDFACFYVEFANSSIMHYALCKKKYIYIYIKLNKKILHLVNIFLLILQENLAQAKPKPRVEATSNLGVGQVPTSAKLNFL